MTNPEFFYEEDEDNDGGEDELTPDDLESISNFRAFIYDQRRRGTTDMDSIFAVAYLRYAKGDPRKEEVIRRSILRFNNIPNEEE